MNCRLVIFIFLSLCASAATPPDLAFYYGTQPPLTQLRHFDQVVVQPNQIQAHELPPLLQAGPLIVAYVSVGEVAQNSVDFAAIQQSWVIGKNPAWDSLVMDYRAPQWRHYLLEKHFRPLWQQGYRAFFLDTMDSYLLVQKQGPERQAQEDGLRELLRTIKSEFSGSKIIVNRGFDVLDTAHDYIDGLIAEAYFSGWDPQTREYTLISQANRQWLHNQLTLVQNKYHIPVTVVDYVNPGEWDKAADYAEKIIAAGFTPWIANGDLNVLGQGRKRVLPRRVLALYDGPQDGQWDHPIFRYVATQLERLGLATDYVNVEFERIPLEPLAGRYAGVVTWLTPRTAGVQSGLCVRLQREAQSGVPTAMLGRLLSGETCARWLNIERNQTLPSGNLRIDIEHPAVAQAEGVMSLRRRELADVAVKNKSQSWLRLRDEKQSIFDPVAITEFGGFGLQPYLVDIAAEDNAQWLLDPLVFFKSALRLNAQPQFDLAHENGLRIALVSLNSDGMSTLAKDASVVAAEWKSLLARSSMPVSLAVSEAEYSGANLADETKSKLVKRLQTILTLSNVELNSHTYSHPFFWRTFDGRRDDSALNYFYTLAQPDYLADLKREIVVAHDNIAQRFNHPVRAMMWSGDAVPGGAALALAQQHSLLHYGGGGVRVVDGKISQANRLPLIRPTAWGIQVLSPLLDENAYARRFNQQALNYRQVLKHNRLLAGDRPWSVSLHWDALARPEGKNVVSDVLRETAAQNVMGLFWSEYVQRARAWHNASVAQWLNGDYELIGDGAHNAKVSGNKVVDITGSENIYGFRHQAQETHFFVANARAHLRFKSNESVWHLRSSTVPVLRWQQNGTQARVQLRATGRAELVIAQAQLCSANTTAGAVVANQKNEVVTLELTAQQAAQEFDLVCH